MPKNPWEPETTNPWDEQAPTSRHIARKPEVRRPSRHHALQQISGPGSPRTLTLQGDELVIGRSTECALRIESNDVSRKHLKLVKKDEEYTFEDLGSRNGVYLNGVKVHSAVLRDQDQIQVGDAVFLYHQGS